jgi:hypothetical protein
MKTFQQWLETNHPELNEGFLKNAALAGAMALGSVAPNMAQADQPTVTTQDSQQALDRLHQKQAERRMWKTPLIATAMGAAAAARLAAAKKQKLSN